MFFCFFLNEDIHVGQFKNEKFAGVREDIEFSNVLFSQQKAW